MAFPRCRQDKGCKPLLWSETLKQFVQGREETLLRKHLSKGHWLANKDLLKLSQTFSDKPPMASQPGSEAEAALTEQPQPADETQVRLQTLPTCGGMHPGRTSSISISKQARQLLTWNLASYGLSPRQMKGVLSPENMKLMELWGGEESTPPTVSDVQHGAGPRLPVPHAQGAGAVMTQPMAPVLGEESAPSAAAEVRSPPPTSRAVSTSCAWGGTSPSPAAAHRLQVGGVKRRRTPEVSPAQGRATKAKRPGTLTEMWGQ